MAAVLSRVSREVEAWLMGEEESERRPGKAGTRASALDFLQYILIYITQTGRFVMDPHGLFGDRGMRLKSGATRDQQGRGES